MTNNSNRNNATVTTTKAPYVPPYAEREATGFGEVFFWTDESGVERWAEHHYHWPGNAYDQEPDTDFWVVPSNGDGGDGGDGGDDSSLAKEREAREARERALSDNAAFGRVVANAYWEAVGTGEDPIMAVAEIMGLDLVNDPDHCDLEALIVGLQEYYPAIADHEDADGCWGLKYDIASQTDQMIGEAGEILLDGPRGRYIYQALAEWMRDNPESVVEGLPDDDDWQAALDADHPEHYITIEWLGWPHEVVIRDKTGKRYALVSLDADGSIMAIPERLAPYYGMESMESY